VVSIGTGSQTNIINVEEALTWGGEAPWVVPALNILMTGSAETTDTEVAALLPGAYHRFDITLATPTREDEIASSAMDDVSAANLEALQDKAAQLIDVHSTVLDDLSKILATPKAPLKVGQQEAVA
jgi:hypothetical protein